MFFHFSEEKNGCCGGGIEVLHPEVSKLTHPCRESCGGISGWEIDFFGIGDAEEEFQGQRVEAPSPGKRNKDCPGEARTIYGYPIL